MIRWRPLLIALLLLTHLNAQAASPVTNERLARIFTDHVVLQRDQAVPIWGWAAPGQVISVSFAGQQVTGVTDANGRWRVQLALRRELFFPPAR